MFTVSTKGRLLVATPPLEDPHFDRTVIYMLEHHEDGAIGVVINRASEDTLEGPLDRWIELLAVPSSVFEGGPVETGAMVGLGRSREVIADDHELLTPLTDDIVSVDLTADPALAAADLLHVRVFRGYAGWGGGQLEAEIDAGAWLTVAGDADDLFTSRPEELWRDVLARQGGRLAWLAGAPDDLSMN